MLSISLQIHRNILSAQCYIRYVDDFKSNNTIEVESFSSELHLLLFRNDEIIKKVKIFTPNDFFIPSSLSFVSDSSLKAGSTAKCRTILTPAGQSITECSFRMQISGPDKLDQSDSELKVDVKDYFKERFKNSGHWNLICANCGVGLPLEPVFIESVREYSESELSEGWFCHGNGPQPALKPSSQILYLDDTSFYLYPKPDSDFYHKVTVSLDEKCCSCHDADCKKDACISVQSTDCSAVSQSDSSDINCSSKSAGCCNSEKSDRSISQDLNSSDFPTTNLTHRQKHNHSTLNLNCGDVKNKNDLDAQVLSNSVPPNIISSCLKQSGSSTRSHTVLTCNDCKHSSVDKKEYWNSSKVLYSAFECHSCGNVLSPEKNSFPFVKFYLDKLMFKNSSSYDDHLEYARKIALASFWSLVTRSQTSLVPTKLFLQSKVDGEELCLLLWIPSDPVAHFLLQDSLEGISPEMNLKTEMAYKVLYFLGTSHSENIRLWRHAFDVDFYCVSDTMVKRLARILDASSTNLPETSVPGGFSYGFLLAPSQVLK